MLHCYSDEKAFQILLDSMIGQDLALRSVVQNAELLVFSSKLLPQQYWSEPHCLCLLKNYLDSIYRTSVYIFFFFFFLHKVELVLELIDLQDFRRNFIYGEFLGKSKLWV